MHIVQWIRGSNDRMPAGQRARQRRSTAFHRVRQTPFNNVDDSLNFHFIRNFLHSHRISSSFIFKFLNSILFYWVVANFLFEINTKSMVLQRPLSFPHHPTGKEVVKAIFQNSDSIGTGVNEFWPQLQRPKFSDRNAANLWRITALKWDGKFPLTTNFPIPFQSDFS